MRLLRRIRDNDSGVALVEMAIVLPLLVVLVFGVVDVGRLVFTKIALNEAVQEGSVWGAYHPDDYAGVQARVAESLNDPVIVPADVVVECPGSTVRVSLSRDVALISPLVSGAVVTVSAAAEGEELSDSVTCVASP